jgi:hypothetical protein
MIEMAMSIQNHQEGQEDWVSLVDLALEWGYEKNSRLSPLQNVRMILIVMMHFETIFSLVT